MNREFLINLLFLISINLVIKPFYVFGVDLQVQNVVGKESYGLYFALFNFSYIFQIFSDLGIQQYNNRNIAQHHYLLDKYFSSILVLKLGLGAGFFLLSYTTAFLLGYQGDEMYLLLFLLLNQLFITFTFFFRSNISGLQYYRVDSVLSVMDKLLMIVGCIPFLYLPFWEITIEKFVYLQTASFGVTTLTSYWLTRQYLKEDIRLKWKPVLSKAILKQSLPFALAVLLMSLYTRIDAVMIERLLPTNGAAEVGVYAAGYRLLDAVNMIGFLFAGLLLPMFSKMLHQKISINTLLSISGRIMFVITSSFSIAVCFHAESITNWMYDDGSSYMASVMVLLLIGFNAIGIIHVVGTLLVANGNLKQLNVVFVLGVLVNIVTNYILIQYYGAWGAAITTIVSQLIVAVIELLMVKRIFKLEWNGYFIVQSMVFVGLIYGINVLLVQITVMWQIQFVLAGLLAVVAAFLTKILSLKLILANFKSKAL